ncbi:methyltransferase domain-containing protein [Cryobacterium sp. AP23]
MNRRGYASLIAGSRRLIGDSPAMLDARDMFLERGWYADLRTALSDLVAAESAHRVIDIGCGTGYYLRGVLAALARTLPAAGGPGAGELSALAVDLSAPAVARTVRAALQAPGSHTAGLVADVWSPLPVRDGAADVLINVFAPRNPAEFHRIVVPGGLLAVVVPHPTHLQELRADGLALDVHENKTADLTASLTGLFNLEHSRDLSAVLSLSPADVTALIGMGPSAHHPRSPEGPGSAEDPAAARPVTVAFRLLAFRRTAS